MAVRDIFDWMEFLNIIPRINLLDVNSDLETHKPIRLPTNTDGTGTEGYTDPFTQLNETRFKDGITMPKLLPTWKAVAAAAQNDSGTLFLGAYTDPKNATALWTLEAYQSQEYHEGLFQAMGMTTLAMLWRKRIG